MDNLIKNINNQPIQIKISITIVVFVLIGYALQLFLNFNETAKMEETLKQTHADKLQNSEILWNEQLDLMHDQIVGRYTVFKNMVNTTISHMMITGNAPLVEDWLKETQEQGIFSDFQIIRTYPERAVGQYAFRDNNTINIVNSHLGSKTFNPKHSANNESKSLEPKWSAILREAIATGEDKFYNDVMPDGSHVRVGLLPIVNSSECQGCHGEDHRIRAVIKLAISEEAIASQEKNIKSALAAGLEQGKKEVEELALMAWYDRLKMFFAAAVSLIAITTVISLVMRKLIVMPIGKIVNVAENIAGGNLTSDIPAIEENEIGLLYRSLDKMQGNLKSMILEIERHSKIVDEDSQQVANLSQEIATGARNQTDQTDQVAAAVEEMSATVQEIARSSASAVTIANEARSAAMDGEKIAKEAVEGIRRISNSVVASGKTIEALGRSSEKINEIIAVIDDIADQTNLLALNAAIEAARAGEAGRGFAVVADEVRKLAERTTKATKEIAEMISNIQMDTESAVATTDKGIMDVQKGVEMVDNAGNSLHRIAELVEGVTAMISSIATAAEQQSSAVNDISTNVHSVASVSRETFQATSESSDNATKLASLSTELRGVIDKFRI